MIDFLKTLNVRTKWKIEEMTPGAYKKGQPTCVEKVFKFTISYWKTVFAQHIEDRTSVIKNNSNIYET